MSYRDVVASAKAARKRGLPPGTCLAYTSSSGDVKYRELAIEPEGPAWERVPIKGKRYAVLKKKKS